MRNLDKRRAQRRYNPGAAFRTTVVGSGDRGWSIKGSGTGTPTLLWCSKESPKRQEKGFLCHIFCEFIANKLGFFLPSITCTPAAWLAVSYSFPIHNCGSWSTYALKDLTAWSLSLQWHWFPHELRQEQKLVSCHLSDNSFSHFPHELCQDKSSVNFYLSGSCLIGVSLRFQRALLSSLALLVVAPSKSPCSLRQCTYSLKQTGPRCFASGVSSVVRVRQPSSGFRENEVVRFNELGADNLACFGWCAWHACVPLVVFGVLDAISSALFPVYFQKRTLSLSWPCIHLKIVSRYRGCCS